MYFSASHNGTVEKKGYSLQISRVVKPIRHDDRCCQCPAKYAITYPCAHNLHPTCPIRSADRHKVALLNGTIASNVLCQKSGNPCCGEHKDDVIQRVVVLCTLLFIVVLVLAAL